MDPQLKFKLLGYCVAIVALAFFLFGSSLLMQARQCQMAGEMMPNGHGGKMTPNDGYEIAAAMFLMSVGWIYCAWRLFQKGSRRDCP